MASPLSCVISAMRFPCRPRWICDLAVIRNLGHGLNSAADKHSAKLRPPFNRELVRCRGKLFPALGEIEIASTNIGACRSLCHDQALFGVDPVHIGIFGHERRAVGFASRLAAILADRPQVHLIN
jgi:hypothetical protein